MKPPSLEYGLDEFGWSLMGANERASRTVNQAGTTLLEITERDVFCQQDTLPSELLYLAGSIGLDIDLSQFPAVEKAETE